MSECSKQTAPPKPDLLAGTPAVAIKTNCFGRPLWAYGPIDGADRMACLETMDGEAWSVDTLYLDNCDISELMMPADDADAPLWHRVADRIRWT